MPNPVRNIRRTDRLTGKQKALVSKLRSSGLGVQVYRRKGNKTRISVHNPYSDAKRIATKAQRPYQAQAHPHAWDLPSQIIGRSNPQQRKLASKRIRTGTRKGKALPSLRKLLLP